MLRSVMKLLLAFGVLALTGCMNEVGEWIDCARVCDHYDTCMNGDFDAPQCADACENTTDRREGYEEQVDTCDACLDEAECSPTCNDVCAGIIPAFPTT